NQCLCGSSAVGPKSFSRVSKSVHGHSKSATWTYYFCNILFLICFNILHLNAEKRQAVTAALITKARNLMNDLGCHWSGNVHGLKEVNFGRKVKRIR
ncbi:unnamed protein product, partial [Porites lobata]